MSSHASKTNKRHRAGMAGSMSQLASERVQVYVRVRPLFTYEAMED